MAAILSHSKKFIFIHNAKVAGSSITQWLKPYDSNVTFQASPIERIGIKLGICEYWNSVRIALHHGHVSAEELSIFLPKKYFHQYYKFGFSRHPLDRLKSLYRFDWKKDDVFGEWTRTKPTFEDYIEGMKERKKVKRHFPQYPVFYDQNQNCLVDYVGKMENLNQELNQLAKRLNLEMKDIPHINQTEAVDYEVSPKHKAMVKDIYPEDFDLFKYE